MTDRPSRAKRYSGNQGAARRPAQRAVGRAPTRLTSPGLAPSPPTERVQRVLALERDKGHRDIAVVGGLDRFLEKPDVSQALQSLGVPHVRYAALSIGERDKWISQALNALSASNAKKGHSEKAAPPERRRPASRAVILDSPVTSLKGVTRRVAPHLEHLGVHTVKELLYVFPNRHSDFTNVTTVAQLRVGEEQTVRVTAWEARETSFGKRRSAEAVVGDETGNIRIVWFNQPYMARNIKTNARLAISGKVSLYRGMKVFESPECEALEDGEELLHTGRLVPVYPLTQGLSGRAMRKVLKEALDVGLPLLQDHLPADLRSRYKLMGLPQAISQSHYPDSLQAKEEARKRLAFDELLQMQVAVLGKRRSRQSETTAIPISTSNPVLESFLGSLPFALTEAQDRVLKEILGDMTSSAQPMSRLLQGEVGSGKTVIALAALLMAAAAGYQGAIMAPTEVLAEQHFINVSRLLGGLARPLQEETRLSAYLDPHPNPISVGLLLGSMKKRAKEEMQQLIAQGAVDIVVGTHAIIQEEVEIPKLALAVVDEQHRFGVMQRAALRSKGTSPHILVMSATPIPRTLALTLYGDLDISVLDQLPPGRQRIRTRWVPSEKRSAAYEFVRKEVQASRQAFVICPLIEDSEVIEAKAALEEHRRLSLEVFPDLRLGLLHGKMTLQEKQQAMEEFRSGKLDVLVATPVVEVGIDIPNATVMMVEGADRFGLSQLHQLRGRVGRGEHPSYCLLLADSPSAEARERLQAMEHTQDGFALAELDLRTRGPGDFFGTRQSGLPELRMAQLSDQDLLVSARREATRILEEDPNLSQPCHHQFREEMRRRFGNVVGEMS